MPDSGKIYRGRMSRGKKYPSPSDADTAYNVGQLVVSCARPSILGNPYRIPDDGTRAEVIALYRTFLQQLEPDHRIWQKLEHLRQQYLGGKEIVLLCYCEGEDACHTDIIKEWIEQGVLE